MSAEFIAEKLAADPRILVIRLTRPEKKNALTAAMYHGMTAALDAANEDPEVRAAVFLGSEGAFSAGNDLAEFIQIASNPAAAGEAPAAFSFLKALVGFDKPLLAGIDGLAVGIGTTLNFHCDLSIASSRSVFATPFVDLGLVPEAASSLLGPLTMGHQRAFALLAAGEKFSAHDAQQAGLVWKVTAPEDVERETLAAAARLAAKPPEALALTRRLLRGDKTTVLSRIEEEGRHFVARLKSQEAIDAFRAFQNRRNS